MTFPHRNLRKTFIAALVSGLLINGCNVSSSDESESSDSSSTSDGQTVGLFMNSSDSYNGYTLFSPLTQTTTYLIDNCGELVQSWPSDYNAQAFYLLKDGNLLHTGKVDATYSLFNEAGGRTGRIELIDYNGDVVWEYELASDTQYIHHDVEYIEDSNSILAIVWEKYTATETEAYGSSRNQETWNERIIEIDVDTKTIIWEWSVFDHLIQDQDSEKANYGVVEDNPGKLDINWTYDDSEITADWLHLNSVDYNAELDQIVLSSRNMSEMYIIDHSCTTEEAEGDTGCTQGKGGDILYRYGNPQVYNMGDSGDQVFFLQHDTNWINDSFTDGGKIMVFNNQAGTNEGEDYSSVLVIDTGVSDTGSYELGAGGTYGPDSSTWTYTDDPETDFYAQNISGSRRLPNGNTLITEGTTGRIFEVTSAGETVWEYVNPVGYGGDIADQYEEVDRNYLFRAARYPSDFEGLSYYGLEPSGTIESGSDYSCEIYTN